MVLSCSSMRASRNLNTISCRVFDSFSRNLHQQCTMGHGCFSASQLGVKRSKVKVLVETALFGLVKMMS